MSGQTGPLPPPMLIGSGSTGRAAQPAPLSESSLPGDGQGLGRNGAPVQQSIQWRMQGRIQGLKLIDYPRPDAPPPQPCSHYPNPK